MRLRKGPVAVLVAVMVAVAVWAYSVGGWPLLAAALLIWLCIAIRPGR